MDASELEKMSTDDIYELVKMAEQAERFDDMKMVRILTYYSIFRFRFFFKGNEELRG